MELTELSSQLTSILTDNLVYLSCETDLTDFRQKTPPKLKVNTPNGSIILDLPKVTDRIGTVIGLLSVSLFSSKRIIIGWNLKNLFSWFQFHSNIPLHPNGKIFDLRLIEACAGESGAKPTTYDEAVTRLRKHINGDAIMAVNNHVYTPLTTLVIPAIETSGLISHNPVTKLYSSYTIEGQVNGRLNSGLLFEGAFNPHSLTDNDKNEFYAGSDKTFLVFDFKFLEVKLLQWITKDAKLAEIIESGEDVYEGVYKAISGSPKCNAKYRDFTKKALIQTIYGIQPTSLAESAGISVEGAKIMIDKIMNTFPTAFGYLQQVVADAKKTGEVKDVLGRKSFYGEGHREPYTARNAVVQAPAAVVCLEKLCDLYTTHIPDMRIVASVHDAYVCVAPKTAASKIARSCVEALESESKLVPGLHLGVTAKMGEKWGQVETIKFNDHEE